MRKSHVLIILVYTVLTGCSTIGQRLSSEDANINSKAIAEFQASAPDLKTKTINELILKLSTRSDNSASNINEYEHTRALAAEALGKIGSEAQSAVPELAKALGDSEPAVRIRAAEALGKIGSEAQSAVPELARGLSDSDVNVRKEVANTLNILGAASNGAAPELALALGDSEPAVRISAAEALGKVGSSMRLLMWKNNIGAAEALGIIGSKAQSAVPVLARALNDSDVSVRKEAANVLNILGEAAKGVVPELTKALGDSEPAVRISAAEALGRIGSEAQSAVPELAKMVIDSDTHVRKTAATALMTINPEQATIEFSNALSTLNDAKDDNLRTFVAETLIALQVEGIPALDKYKAFKAKKAEYESPDAIMKRATEVLRGAYSDYSIVEAIKAAGPQSDSFVYLPKGWRYGVTGGGNNIVMWGAIAEGRFVELARWNVDVNSGKISPGDMPALLISNGWLDPLPNEKKYVQVVFK